MSSEPSSFLFRTDDLAKWGTGKGANLTPTEVDLNWWEAEQRLQAVEENPLQPLQIQEIVVEGNQMVIVLSDGLTEFGPFTLPQAAFAWRDAWSANTLYEIFDVFTEAEGMYLVLQAHESATEFDPDEENGFGPLYKLIFPYPKIYDIGFFFPGQPGSGIAANQAMFTFRASRSFILPAGLPGTVGGLQQSAAAHIVFPIYKNETQIGTITIGDPDSESESESEPEDDIVVSFAADVQFDAGDRLRILRPSSLDSNAKDFSLNIAASLV